MHQASVKRSDTEGQKPPVTPSAQGEAGALTWVSQEPEEGFLQGEVLPGLSWKSLLLMHKHLASPVSFSSP